MNKNQRERIAAIASELIDIRDEEQDKFDNIPENMQGGDRAGVMENNIDNLTTAIDALESIE